MPFVSKAQRRWMYANKPDMAEKWEKETAEDADLPEYRRKRKAKKGMDSGVSMLMKMGSKR